MTTGTLELQGVVLRVRLGVLETEKLSARDLPLDISWTGTLREGPGVDYAAVCEKLAVLQDRDYDYLEEVAEEVLSLLEREFPEGLWKVRAVKPFPPACLKIGSASFTLEGGENG